MPISNGRCSQGPKWAMQLWLDLRPLLGGVVVPTEINFLGILNVNAKKKAGICWEYTTVANHPTHIRHNVRIMMGPCLILFLLTITSIQHHPTSYNQIPIPPKKSGCVGTSWCHVFHQLHGLHPAGRHDSPQQHVLRLQRLHRTQEMQGRWPGGTSGTAAGDGGSENRSDLQGDSGLIFLANFRIARIARMDDWWSDIYVVILLGDLWNVYSWWSMFWRDSVDMFGKLMIIILFI